MSGHGWRPHLESGLCLNLGDLFARAALRAGCSRSGGWHWTRNGERVASLGYSADLGDDSGELTLIYTHTKRGGNEREDVTCRIHMSSIPLHYGGRRWYGHCPYTGQRTLTLHKFPGIAYFCHRTAIRPLPSYKSQRDSGSDRIMRQRWAIRRKIGDDFSDLFGEPFKPKWMRWRTFERHVARDAALADRESVYMLRLVGRILAKDPRDSAALALLNGG
jgi:hypothetical protein